MSGKDLEVIEIIDSDSDEEDNAAGASAVPQPKKWNDWNDVKVTNHAGGNMVAMLNVKQKTIFNSEHDPSTCEVEDLNQVRKWLSEALGMRRRAMAENGPLPLDTIQKLLEEQASIKLTKLVQVENKISDAKYAAIQGLHRHGVEVTTYHGTRVESVPKIMPYGYDKGCAERNAIGNGTYAATRFFMALVYADAHEEEDNKIIFKILFNKTWADNDPVFGSPQMKNDFGVHRNGTLVFTSVNLLMHGKKPHTQHAHRTVVCSQDSTTNLLKFVGTFTLDLNQVAPWCSDPSFFTKPMAEMSTRLLAFKDKLNSQNKDLFQNYSGGFPGNLLVKMRDNFVRVYRQQTQQQEFSDEWEPLLQSVFRRPFDRGMHPPSHYAGFQELHDYPGYPNYRGPPPLPKEAAAAGGVGGAAAGGVGGAAARGAGGAAAGGAGGAAAGGAGGGAAAARAVSQQVQRLEFMSAGKYWDPNPQSRKRPRGPP